MSGIEMATKEEELLNKSLTDYIISLIFLDVIISV